MATRSLSKDKSPEPPVRKPRRSPSVQEEEMPKKSPSKSPPPKVIVKPVSLLYFNYQVDTCMISELFASAVHDAAKLVSFSHTLVAQYCNVNGSQPDRDSCPRYFDEC